MTYKYYYLFLLIVFLALKVYSEPYQLAPDVGNSIINKDNKYIYEGREYNLYSHGFAKNMVFEVQKMDSPSEEF